ncbi:MAG TPA: hypothetical protein VJ764_08460, partial [Steroidobacteraceae bacterium]|nr:hypothetical protein [Steroidobacteraceae bacterium]
MLVRTLDFTLTGLTEDLRPRRDRRLGRAATLVAVLAGIFVLATAELRLDPGNQDFGEQRVGTSGQVASFWLENSSKETFEVETRVEGDAAS